MRAWRKKRRKAEPEKVGIEDHRAKIWKLYGLTSEGYETLLKDQKGVCALCGRPPKIQRLSVDHDHDTGRIRGLLCRGCNSSLGQLGDTLDNLKKVLIYLLGGK